jgi:hypothetical protein
MPRRAEAEAREAGTLERVWELAMKITAVLAAACFATACGGHVEMAVTDGGPVSVDAGTWDGSLPHDAGYTRCSTPEGWGICGDATACPASPSRPECSDGCELDSLGGGVGICNDFFGQEGLKLCPVCDDDSVCYDPFVSNPTGQMFCLPYSLGVLLSQYVKDSNRLRYADLSFWTGDELPTATSCPTFATFQICGGTCGGCAPGQLCVGRSPTHPFGFCVTESATEVCTADGSIPCHGVNESCFTFAVSAGAQALADRHGLCLDSSQCHDVASMLPGGGKCSN